MLSPFPARDVLDEFLDLIESASEGFLTYFCINFLVIRRDWKERIAQLYGPLDGMYIVVVFNGLHSNVN